MAFYHRNSCDCPTGCCDCGPSQPVLNHIFYDPKKNEIWESTYERDHTLRNDHAIRLGSLEQYEHACPECGHKIYDPRE